MILLQNILFEDVMHLVLCSYTVILVQMLAFCEKVDEMEDLIPGCC